MRKGYFFLLGFAVVLATMLPGCPSIATEYVESDRATYNAVEPLQRGYIENDPAMHDADGNLNDDGKLAIGVLKSWDYRLRQAEKKDGDK